MFSDSQKQDATPQHQKMATPQEEAAVKEDHVKFKYVKEDSGKPVNDNHSQDQGMLQSK